MTWETEAVLAGATVVLGVATVLLAWFTHRLARHTKVLARATGDLRKIETRREEAEARRRRMERLRTKIAHTEEILTWNFAAWRKDYLERGACPRPEGDRIRELAVLMEYGKDHANRELVEGLVRVIERLMLREVITGPEAEKFVEEAGHLVKLRPDIPRWQRELMELSLEESRR